MPKKLICAVLVLVSVLLCAAALADSDASALTLDELMAWRDTYKAMALSDEPMNDPHEDGAYSEDGYAFIYDFGTIYADRPEMTADTVINAIVVNDSEQTGVRGVNVDMTYQQVLAAFYSENDDLDGDRNFAGLYLVDMMPAGASWAWVQRDGQRISGIQYAVHEQYTTGGDGYTDAGLLYTIQDGYVAAIRAYGLNSRVNEESVRETVTEVQQVMGTSGYTEVYSSLDGSTLEKFSEADLTFSGINFLTETPEEAEETLGTAIEDVWTKEDDGTWMREMEFDGCDMTFTYNSKKKDAKLYSVTITGTSMDGPRGVCPGDSLTSILNRFRNGEGSYDEASGTETLYGTEGTAPYAVACYGDDAAVTMYYVTETGSGDVVMMLELEVYELTAVTICCAD